MVHLITNYNYDWAAFKKEETEVKVESDSILNFLHWFKNAGEVLQLDIETNVVDKLYDREVYVVQIGSKDAGEDKDGNSYGEQWIFDIPRMSEEELLLLKSVLSSKKKTWIIHNAAFEYTVLKMTFGLELYKVFDTFLMSKVLFNGKDTPMGFHGLAGAVQREFGFEMSKEEQTSFKGEPLNIKQIVYAATDVAVMGRLYDYFVEKAIQDEGEPTVDLENKAVRAFGDIQTNGLLLDWDEWMSNADIFTQELEQVKSDLNNMLFAPDMYTDCVRLNLIQAQDEYFFRWNSIAFKREMAEIVGITVKPTLMELEKLKKELKASTNPLPKEVEQLTIVKYLLNKQFNLLERHFILGYDQELIDRKVKVLKDNINFEWTQQIKRLQSLQIIHPDLTSTSDQALSRLSSPLVRKYKEWAKKAKLVSSFGKSFEKYVEGDGKVRTSINQVMATGRISSNSPNLQNLPHVSKFRNPFKADDSTKRLIIADYSSQEVLIAATLADEPAWIKGIENGYDLHSYNASLIFDDWEDVAEDTCEYYYAHVDKEGVQHPDNSYSKCSCKQHGIYRTSSKTITFGLIYGMGVMKLSETLDIDKTKAKELMAKFFDAFPAVEKFMNDTKQSGIDNNFIETAEPFRRKRYFETPRDKKEEASIRRKSGNTVIQGTAADMVKLSLALIKEELDTNTHWNDVQIKMQIHDEIICQADEDQAEEWAARQVAIMEYAAEHILQNDLLKSTVIISEKWEK